uniref:hypothetical protein n=1 Tax=Paenibacillus xylanexedens TaxID=528191 RepID=UPI003F79FA49
WAVLTAVEVKEVVGNMKSVGKLGKRFVLMREKVEEVMDVGDGIRVVGDGEVRGRVEGKERKMEEL